MRSAEASKAAAAAAQEHGALMKEVHLHNSRHAELWAAAERYALSLVFLFGRGVELQPLSLFSP